MNKIRTRETYEGPVRTIDRAAILSKSLKRTAIRTKEQVNQTTGYEQEQNENVYAGDRTFGMAETGALLGKDAAIKGLREAKQISQYKHRSKERVLNERYEYMMGQMGSDVIIIDPEKEYMTLMGSESKFVKTAGNIYQNENTMPQIANKTPNMSLEDITKVPERSILSGMNATKSATIQAEKGQEILKKQYRTKRAGETMKKKSDRSLKKSFASLKRTIKDSKVVAGALAITGCIALISIIVCTFFGSAFYILGDDNGSEFIPDDLIGIGDASIVEVAASQIGNEGGEPYWSWYGFNGRVEWCACFVSWCANKCGYIDKGIIPKFAGVGTGIDWFQDRHQWQKRGYQPKPGDIIFFDWEGNGYGSHVGIVEKSDDLYVYTIEGNSGDKCCRRTYFLHSSVVMGYGIPKYDQLIDNTNPGVSSVK